MPPARPVSEQLAAFPFLKHLGIYGYRRETLLRLVEFPVSPLEQAEKLEQLRALENGIDIAVVKVDYDSVGVDVPATCSSVAQVLAAALAESLNDSTLDMKFIFVTGGVVSSLGKGLTAAALGTLLENRGLKVALQKFDPYLNVDPGTMSPYQHGEVYVLDDGAETDLDLGHYERFTNVKLTRFNNLTSGQVYQTRSRQGTPRRLPRQHRPGHPPHHRRNPAPHPPCGRAVQVPTSSSPKSAARPATSKGCPSWKPSAPSP